MEHNTYVRSAQITDAHGIALVHVAAWQSAYRGLLPDDTLDHLTVQDAQKRWEERLAAPTGEYLVLTHGRQVAGFVGFGPAGDDDLGSDYVGEIYVLYVAPEHWRKGYGMALMREAMGALGALGVTEVILWALHNNEQATAFYKAVGFLPDGARQVKHRRDGTEMIVVRFRWKRESRL